MAIVPLGPQLWQLCPFPLCSHPTCPGGGGSLLTTAGLAAPHPYLTSNGLGIVMGLELRCTNCGVGCKSWDDKARPAHPPS